MPDAASDAQTSDTCPAINTHNNMIAKAVQQLHRPVALLRGLSESSESLVTRLRGTCLAGGAEGSAAADHLTRFLAAAVGARLLVRLMPFLVSAARLRGLSGLMFSAGKRACLSLMTPNKHRPVTN